MVKAAQMVESHLAGILAHWKWGVTNAFMEGLNSVFSATKRKARGYRSTTPPHYHALLRGRQTPLTPILIPPKTARNLSKGCNILQINSFCICSVFLKDLSVWPVYRIGAYYDLQCGCAALGGDGRPAPEQGRTARAAFRHIQTARGKPYS